MSTTRRFDPSPLVKGLGLKEAENMDGIFLQGLQVYSGGSIIYERKLPLCVVEVVEGWVTEGQQSDEMFDVEIVGYDGDEIYSPKGKGDGRGARELNEEYAEPRVIETDGTLSGRAGEYHKLLLLAPSETINEIKDQLVEMSRDENAGFTVTQALPTMLEVLPQYTGKCEGLKSLLLHYGLRSTECVSVGDAQNDEDMLEFAGVSFACRDAGEGAREKSTFVVDLDTKDGGVARGVKISIPDIFKRIRFVTGNENKAREVGRIMEDEDVMVERVSLELPEVQGSSAVAIATEKLKEAEKNLPSTAVLIEDTSLEFNALGGLPGPYVKWFLEKLGHEGLNKMLDGFEDRGAVARTVIAYTDGEGNRATYEGCTRGNIVRPRYKGETFGWDPIFQCEEGEFKRMTYGEMTAEQKDKCGHRGKAFAAFKKSFS